MLDFLPPTLNFFSVSAHFQFAVRFVQSARSTANRLAELASINFLAPSKELELFKSNNLINSDLPI
jgi:hypothetical protein